MNGIALPQHVVELNPIISLEVELAYGVSAVFICDALNARKETRHIAIDPNMAERGGLNWDGIGMANLHRAGYGDIVRLAGCGKMQCLQARDGRAACG